MSGSRPVLVLLFATSATATGVVWLWDRPPLAFGVAFLGLAVLHLYTLVRLARVERDLATLLSPKNRRTKAKKGSEDIVIPRERPDTQPPPARIPRPAARKPSRKPAPKPARKPVEPAPRAEEPAAEPWEPPDLPIDGDPGEDVEDVSFLPPYASAEADWMEGDADDGDGAAPEGAVNVPGGDASPSRNVPIPRHFALGTVAIIRKMLTPAEVAQILVEQRKRPRQRFGDLAVEIGLLNHGQLEELLLAQQEGLFTDDEIREARLRLKTFRETEASPAGVGS